MSRTPPVLLVTKGLDIGGVERIVTDLAVGLGGREVDVAVALINPDRDRLAPIIEAGGITVHRLAGKPSCVALAGPVALPGDEVTVANRPPAFVMSVRDSCVVTDDAVYAKAGRDTTSIEAAGQPGRHRFS